MNIEVAELRAVMIRATRAIVVIAMEQLEVDDRIEVLTGAWDDSVRPSLLKQAEDQMALRKARAFHVPFPVELRKP